MTQRQLSLTVAHSSLELGLLDSTALRSVSAVSSEEEVETCVSVRMLSSVTQPAMLPAPLMEKRSPIGTIWRK